MNWKTKDGQKRDNEYYAQSLVEHERLQSREAALLDLVRRQSEGIKKIQWYVEIGNAREGSSECKVRIAGIVEHLLSESARVLEERPNVPRT